MSPEDQLAIRRRRLIKEVVKFMEGVEDGNNDPYMRQAAAEVKTDFLRWQVMKDD